MKKQSKMVQTLKSIPKYYRHVSVFVALVLLGLSLRHQALGVQLTTGVEWYEAWMMACGIDVAMVAAEISIMANVRTNWCKVILVATLLISAFFNVLGFGFFEHQQIILQLASLVLGVIIPTFIYGCLAISHSSVTSKASTKSKSQRSRKTSVTKLVAIR